MQQFSDIPDTHTVQQGRTHFKRQRPASECTLPSVYSVRCTERTQPCQQSTVPGIIKTAFLIF
jgi:hypothetical protein